MKTTKQIKAEKKPQPNNIEKKPSIQASHEAQNDQQNHTADTPVADAGSVSASGNDNRKVSREDIELVQNLIERCLQLYMNRDEVVKTLLNRARIDPGFTTLVWQKLEEENADFFRAYYIRLKLKKQIILFNHLLEHQYHLMKYPAPPKVPLAPMQNGISTMPETGGNLHAIGFGACRDQFFCSHKNVEVCREKMCLAYAIVISSVVISPFLPMLLLFLLVRLIVN